MSRIVAGKRKREEDPPRITFSAQGRTFERLFKEQSLEALKNTVRKKLGLSSEALEFSQIRDGKDIDLEDEDDFDAFKSFAVSNGVARVRVKVPSVPSRSGLPSQPQTITSSEETQLDPAARDKSSHGGQGMPIEGPMTLTQILMAGVMPLSMNIARVSSAFSADAPSQSDNISEQHSATPNVMGSSNVLRAKIPKRKDKQASQGTLDDTGFGSNKHYPAKPYKDDNEMNRVVEEFLNRLDGRLCEHLKGLPWKDVWQASEDTQPHYAQFIKNLVIPQVLGRPALLLHCLGDGVVDPEILSELADGSSKILINTSGSGKTRLLLELLVMKWGFYFTTAVDFANLRLGSQDVYDAIFMQIPNHANFTEKPKDVHSNNSSELEPAYRRNHNIVARFVYQILTARVIVFEHFLTTFRTLFPGRNTDFNKAKLHWLSLQLNSSEILGCDVFKDLTKILDDASNNFVMMDSLEIQNRFYRAVSEFKLDSDIFLVLDEAQVAAEQLAGCFKSYRSPEKPHAVLSPIIKSWLAATYFPIIVSSTGLSLNAINETVTSGVGKPATFSQFTTTGAFDDKVRQDKYIRRYTPPGFLDSDSGKEFLQRAWNFARGRHRFTAALLTQLLRASFQSPHRTLNAFVKALCRYTPSDAEQFIKTEPEIREDFGAIIPLDFTKITSMVDVLCNVSRALYKWLVLRIRLPFEKEKDDLIQLGFARFVNDPEKGYIDEPLVLLGAAQEFSESPFPLEFEALSGLQSHEGRGEHFEEYVAYSLTYAFDGQRKLCEIFSFGEHVPDWAQQCAELVVLTVDNGVVVSDRFHLPEYLGSTASIGKRCETVDVTLEWFRNPSSVICFPDKYMGPSIVLFVCLDSGLILAIEVQCKWVSKGTLDKETWESTVSTLDLAQLYRRKSLGARKADKARGTVLGLFNRLNPTTPLPNDKWFQDGLPVLRLIASFPATPSEAQRRGSTYYATLNMDYCAEVTHATGLLKSVSFSLLNARKYTGGGSAVVPAKRQHT